MKRISYQNGGLTRIVRAKGPDVWVFRYRDAEGIHKAEQIGTLERYKTKAAAQKQAAAFLKEINERLECIKVSGFCDLYEKEGMPARMSTAGPYRSYLKRFRAEWGDWRLDAMARDMMAVEQWIDGLETIPTEDRKSKHGKVIKGRPARPMAKKSKLLMKAFVHRLFELAIKWGKITMQRNPIGLVEVSGRSRRVRAFILLTGQQYQAIISDPELGQHVRVMIEVAMILGLRASEFLGLRWDDVNFEKAVIKIQRSHVGQYVDDTKTEGSEQELPMHEYLAELLKAWRAEREPVNGWLFGNPQTGRPYWRGTLQQDHLAPAGVRAGVVGSVGWHALRHGYRAWMRELGIDLEDQRTLMRHEDTRTTLGYGGKTPAEQVRPANAKVVEMVRRSA